MTYTNASAKEEAYIFARSVLACETSDYEHCEENEAEILGS